MTTTDDVTNRAGQLSPREREIIALTKDGLSSKEIARQLGISPRTVDTHVANAIATLGVRNRLEAALRLGGDPASVDLRKQPPTLVGDPDLPSPLSPGREGIARWWWRLPILRNGRSTNDLTRAQRLAWILIGSLAIIILFSQLANGLRVAQEIALGLRH